MPPKNSAAVELGRRGGKATAKNRTAEERAEAARKAVQARWSKQRAELEKLTREIKEGTTALLKKARKRQKL
jgi:hypothetical protein